MATNQGDISKDNNPSKRSEIAVVRVSKLSVNNDNQILRVTLPSTRMPVVVI
jgi:hypothetical protein